MHIHIHMWEITGTLGVALLAWFAYLGVQRWRTRDERADTWAVADTARTYEMPVVPQIGPVRRQPWDRPVLPSQAERTDMMMALRDDCARCGIDHVGDCAAAQATVVFEDDYITGEIVPVSAVRDPEPSAMDVIIAEYETEWHTVGGEWEAPAALTRGLRHDDWLLELLTEKVPA